VLLTHAGSGAISVDLVRRRLEGPSLWGERETLATQVSIDGGGQWSYFDGEVPAGVYEYRVQLAADPSQVSAWRRVTVPFALVLEQSVPNPFDLSLYASASIAFSIGGAPSEVSTGRDAFERVELSVYDVRGARVATIFTRRLGPGDYESSWDGFDDSGERVASGVYFYRLSVGSFALTRKLVVLHP
jgi:hypothetical protein